MSSTLNIRHHTQNAITYAYILHNRINIIAILPSKHQSHNAFSLDSNLCIKLNNQQYDKILCIALSYDQTNKEIVEEILETNVDLDEIHDISEIYCLSNNYFCNMLDNHNLYTHDCFKSKLEFSDDES